jgi:hypothetical protein
MYSASRYAGMTLRGLPHSDIHGSKLVCSSPWLFAAYHVLHRLLVPRHPPNTLSSLTTNPFPHDNTEVPRERPASSLLSLSCLDRLRTRSRRSGSLFVSCTQRRSASLQYFSNRRFSSHHSLRLFNFHRTEGLVEDKGFEPSTSGLQSPRSPS